MTASPVEIGKLKNGDWFTIANHDNEEVDSSVVWIRREYDHSTRKYLCVAFDDCSRSRQLKGKTKVFTGFIF